MARPTKPLITKKTAIQAALQIIDEEGLDALSMRKLGDAMDVKARSLYHHFEDKDEILLEVCAHIFAGLKAPETEADNFPVWFLENARTYFIALCEHRELIPVLIHHHPLKIGTGYSQSVIWLLSNAGVSEAPIVALMEALSGLCLGMASYYNATQIDPLSGEWQECHRDLAKALNTGALTHDELFEIAAEGVIRSVLTKFELERFVQPLEKPGP